MDYTFFLIGGVLFLMGSSFFVVSLIIVIQKKMRMKKWTKTAGIVTDVKSKLGMQQPVGTPRSTLFRPTVRFQTTDGRVIVYQTKTYNNWSNYEIGQQIEVYYDPQQPEKVMFGMRTIDRFRFGVFIVLGGFMALFGILFILVSIAFPKF